MTLPEGFTFSAVTADDQRAILDFDLWAFPAELTVDDFMREPSPLDHDRAVVVRDSAGEIAAMHASYEFTRFPVPGTRTAVSGLTWVGVHPQHRRQGLLRAMISRYLADTVQRGEAISVLFAAEPTIYGRFGYGLAAYDLRAKLSRGAGLRELAGAVAASDSEANLKVRIETFDPDRHAELMEDLHFRAGADVGGTGLGRPGWAGRETQALRDAFYTNVELLPGKREAARIVILERDGAPVAYSRFRRKTQWENTGPSGQVNAGEVVALDAAASRKLWSVLLDLDLTSEISAFMIPVDDPIVNLLENNRSVSMTHSDNLWVRLVDVPAALTQRQYAADMDVVLEVSDARLPDNAGRYRLRASAFADGVEVERTDAAADLTLDVRELGSAYLGGVSVAALANAGLVKVHNPGALAAASTAFGWPHAPVSSWVF